MILCGEIICTMQCLNFSTPHVAHIASVASVVSILS